MCPSLIPLPPHSCLPQTAGEPTTNGPWAQGEGLALARSAGASLLHLDHVQARHTLMLLVHE